MYEMLRTRVLEANIEIKKLGLVILTWGNVSAIDRDLGVIAIKPSGIGYEKMTADDITIVDLDGKLIDGKRKPSVDLPTHVELYKQFKEIGSVVHTHSTYATSWAQKGIPIPLLGTTHADYFYGDIPCARTLREEELEDYEANTGRVIAEALKGKNPLKMPAIIVDGHGAFAWGTNLDKAVEHAYVLENVAKMAYLTITLPGETHTLPKYISNKHYQRKHGPKATYGQD